MRCAWATKEIFHHYHDTEWGKPSHNDTHLFEFLILEGAQAGLSWETILKRRETYRKAYKNFDPKKVAKFTQKDEERLMQDPGVIRNKLKIKSSIKNAQVFLEIQKEHGSFSNYLWSFTNNKVIKNNIKSLKDVPVTSEVSDALSKDLKKHGMSFVGSTIMYAYLQAVGVVNDHEMTCPQR